MRAVPPYCLRRDAVACRDRYTQAWRRAGRDQRGGDAWTDARRQRAAIDRQEVDPRPTAQAHCPEPLLALAVGGEFRLGVGAENVAGGVGECRFGADDHRAGGVGMRLDLSSRAESIADAELPPD